MTLALSLLIQLAQLSPDMMRLLWPAAIAAMLLIILLTMFGVVKSIYKRCASNQLLVVYGAGIGRDGATCRVVHGGGMMVMPVVQAYQYISLEPIQFESSVRGALSKDKVRVDLSSQIAVAVGTSPALMQNAATRLLDTVRPVIGKLADDIVASTFQRLIASMRADEIQDRHGALLPRFESEVEPELSRLGLVLINVRVVDVVVEPSNA